MVGPQTLKLDITASCGSYFYEKLQPYRLDAGLEFYLVSLLSEYTNVQPQPECLAFMLKDAVEAPPSLKIKHFKQMGDHCLAFSGCFREFVEAKSGRRYYDSMGRNAYNATAGLVRDDDFHSLYRQLGQCVPELSDLIHSIFRKLPGKQGIRNTI